MSFKSHLMYAGLFIILVISACNMPSNTIDSDSAGAVLTAAAQTVEANLTQAAGQNQPDNTPVPTNTTLPTSTQVAPANTLPVAATSTQTCDQAQFIKDVNVPDGTKYAQNESFTKTWRLKNTGTCSWSGYSLVFDAGDAMSGPASVPIGTVAAGQEVDLSVNLKAPGSDGTYRGYWRVKSNGGVLLPIQGGYQSKSFYVEIKVGEGDDDDDDGPFAVTSVSMSVSGSCGNFQIKADIKTNGAGTVTYKWKRSDGATDNANHPDLVFNSAGTKSVTTQWLTNASGDKWMDIYIDNPNHQQFGRANFSCP